MGDYTRLFFNAPLRNDTPQEVREVLRYMSGTMEDQPETPDHQLFWTERWRSLFLCSSAYHGGQFCKNHIPDTFSPTLFFCADLKNYDSEIKLFCDWIHPYISTYEEKFLGFVHDNHEDYPEVLRYTESGIEYASLNTVTWQSFDYDRKE
jgi:hypothetical protein